MIPFTCKLNLLNQPGALGSKGDYWPFKRSTDMDMSARSGHPEGPSLEDARTRIVVVLTHKRAVTSHRVTCWRTLAAAKDYVIRNHSRR
jgi:hypothetical protein